MSQNPGEEQLDYAEIWERALERTYQESLRDFQQDDPLGPTVEDFKRWYIRMLAYLGADIPEARMSFGVFCELYVKRKLELIAVDEFEEIEAGIGNA